MILSDIHSPMLDWYITHVYVLPWWAYAVPLYPLIGASTFRTLQIVILEEHDPECAIAPVIVLWWPLVAVFTLAYTAFRASGWLLGFTDTLPLSFSKEGGYTE